MTLPLDDLSRRFADRSTIGYLMGFFLGLVLLLVLLFQNQFDFLLLFGGEGALLLLSVSGVVMRFLSGFGVMLTYAYICSIVLRNVTEQVKGSRKRMRLLKLALIIPSLVVLIYAVYAFVNAYFYSQSLTLIENLTAVYGIWSLILLVYIIPIVREEYSPQVHGNSVDSLDEKLGNWKHALWKGYQLHVWKDYGRVYSEEFKRYQQRMTEIRAILSGILLLPTAFVLMILPPIGILAIMLWFRVFSMDNRPLTRGERFLLVFILATALLVATYLFLAMDISETLVYFNASYSIGVFFSIALFGVVVWQA
ncbi:MAG: hypothetical protein ACE5H4_12210 [Candidatus Thorarchaeota archaeon]